MNAHRVALRRLAAGIGVLAVAGMGALSACAREEVREEPTTTITTPTTTTTTTTTPPPVEPTEKGLDPHGPNKFTPTVKAPPAPTADPG
jgi:hypothetical protein